MLTIVLATGVKQTQQRKKKETTHRICSSSPRYFRGPRARARPIEKKKGWGGLPFPYLDGNSSVRYYLSCLFFMENAPFSTQSLLRCVLLALGECRVSLWFARSREREGETGWARLPPCCHKKWNYVLMTCENERSHCDPTFFFFFFSFVVGWAGGAWACGACVCTSGAWPGVEPALGGPCLCLSWRV